MLNILSLSIKGGENVTVIAEGEDEVEAAQAIGLFFTGWIGKSSLIINIKLKHLTIISF